MKDTQFQHYVPKFYLKGWEVPAGPFPQRVWVYEKGQKPRHASVKSTGGGEDYYAVRDGHGNTDNKTVESFLGKGESRAGKLFIKIKNKIPLTRSDRIFFSEFLSVLYRRSSYSQENAGPLVKESLPQVIRPLLRLAESIPDEPRRMRAIANIKKVESEADTEANSRSLAAKVVMEPTDIPNYIRRMDWGFFYNENLSVVASDNPLVYDRRRGISNIENGYILLPIDRSNWFFAMNWTRYRDGYWQMPNEIVDHMNLRIIEGAHRQVYANRNDEALEDLVNRRLGVAL